MNNPIMYADPSGHFAISAALFYGTIIFGALIGGGTAAYSSIKKGDEWYEIALKTIQELAIIEYKIVDMNDKEVLKVNTTIENATKGKVEDGKVLLNLSMKEANLVFGENYKIVINSMYGLAKAEQPFKITGNWNCEFVR